MIPRCSYIYILLLFFISASSVYAASFTASVDRTQLNAGESFELVLESDDTAQFLTPDLTPLQSHFTLLSSKQVNRFTDPQPPVTQWILTLLPKQTGFVVIPPISLGELNSAPINLTIREAKDAGLPTLEPVYIDSQLQHESVYVQAQLLLTLRVYHAVPLFADGNLTPLLIDNARVEQLGKPHAFEQHINGVRHGVIEFNYAIFPQQSGDFTIPSQTFSASFAGSGSNTTAPFASQAGQRITVKSAQIPLQVKPIPDIYPKDAVWLPAQQLDLKQQWTPSLDTILTTGSAATRLLTLTAQGLPSSQLPSLAPNPTHNYKTYIDQPLLSHKFSENGLFSSRSERHALVFHQSGQQKIAAVKLPWWNTITDQLEYAQLDALNLSITAQSDAPRAAPLTNDTSPLYYNRALLHPQQLLFWQLLSLCFMLLSVFALALWWRARHQPAVIVPVSHNAPSARSLQEDLKRACLANDPHSTRQALDAWARQHTETLADMAARDTNLSTALEQLNSALYSESTVPWQGKDLWQAILQLSFAQSSQTDDNEQLPPLYPP